MPPLAVGSSAPEFSLARHERPPFTRADLLGATTVLAFYPFAFSPVCSEQLVIYNEVLEDFIAEGATIYGVSCDATWSQQAFRTQLGLDIEQLSDFHPKGRVAEAFGVMHSGGYPRRALFLFGPDGVLRWLHMSTDSGEVPGPNLIFDALAA